MEGRRPRSQGLADVSRESLQQIAAADFFVVLSGRTARLTLPPA
jgi:hypothetical protein